MLVLLTDRARFLLAQLHMDSLRDKTSSKLIRKALEILPKGSDALDLAYHGAMQRVEDQMEGVRVLAKQLLGWLTYSERLMTVEEIQHALAVEPGTPDFDEDNLGDIDEIVGFCAGLVIIDEETQIIRLVHYTTQEYFRRNGDKILTSAQQDIAISCLTYLLYEEYRDGWVVEVEKEENIEGDNGGDAPRNEDEYEDEDFFRPWSGKSRKSVEARVQKHPFLEYAARYWVTHAILCEQPNVTELMMTLVKDDRRVSSASQVLFFLDREFDILEMFDRIKSRSSLSAMHVLAYLGFEEMISELLNHGIEADDEDSAQRTPLWWAASRGHHAAVELLLSQNHVNANNRGLAYDETCNQVSARTPLGMVAESGKDKVVKLLIEREDVDVNLSDGYGNSPLSLAARGGHGTVVELLLTRRDIDVNLTNSLDEVPLSLAAFHGREDIVKQLLKREHVQINSRVRIFQSKRFLLGCKMGHMPIQEQKAPVFYGIVFLLGGKHHVLAARENYCSLYLSCFSVFYL